MRSHNCSKHLSTKGGQKGGMKGICNMRALNRLPATAIKSLPLGKHCDGGGLWLNKRNEGSSWFFRYTIAGNRREMGLGSLHNVGLKQARDLAEKCRARLGDGLDPIKQRDKQLREQSKLDTTLKTIALQAFESKKAELRGDGVNGRWFTPIGLHVIPKLGNYPIEEITQRDLERIIKPLWNTKHETARKALNRLNVIIKYAAALGLNVDIGVVDKARQLLGPTRHRSRKMPALSAIDTSEFYQSLADLSPTHLCMKLLILTGLRSRPVRYARADQFDGDIWTIPGEMMKGKRGKTEDFRVPLSKEAQSVVADAMSISRDGFLFPSIRKGVISDSTLSKHMRDKELAGVPHGFRSTLRTWLTDNTDIPFDVAEMIIAHKTGSKVARAYNRTDYIDQRRSYMERWADFLVLKTGPR
jgi:integrase